MILLQHSLAVIGALVAAVLDASSGRIPNRLSLSLLGLGLGSAALLPGLDLAQSLIGAALTALPVSIVFFATQGRGVGGGDVKLLAALGACLGPETGLESELAALLAALTASAVRLAWRGTGGLTELRTKPVRFGPAILVGTLYALAVRGGWGMG